MLDKLLVIIIMLHEGFCRTVEKWSGFRIKLPEPI